MATTFMKNNNKKYPTENPLHCSCDAQKLWEWLRDHRKWSSSTNSLTSNSASTSIVTSSLMSSSSLLMSSSGQSSASLMMSSNDNVNYLRCEHPAELRGKIFAKMEPQQFCDAPLIPKIAIQDIQPYSVIVSWQSREHLGLNGYEIVYHATSETGGAPTTGGGGGGSMGAGGLADIDEVSLYMLFKSFQFKLKMFQNFAKHHTKITYIHLKQYNCSSCCWRKITAIKLTIITLWRKQQKSCCIERYSFICMCLLLACRK